MFYPTKNEVMELTREYNLIPVRYSFLADVETPISVYQKLRKNNSFLLESVEGGERWARYSFIGIDPKIKIYGKNNEVKVTRKDETITVRGNPVEILWEEVKRYKSPLHLNMPRFTGGAVGFFSFDILRNYENLPGHQVDDLHMNDVQFLFADTVVAFDHLRHEVQVIKNILVEKGDSQESIESRYDRVCDEIRRLVKEIRKPYQAVRNHFILPEQPAPLTVKSNMEKTQFEEMVLKAKEYIAAGDIFQVVLSQRFEVEADIDPFTVYRVLRLLNPSPYMYFFQFEDEVLVGTSPELLVRVENGRVENRPIAGTRKRGKTAKEDRELMEDLLADEKERAEHLMLVDLGRNDVGRVSKFGSVRVDQLMEVEYYSHVMHLVSHVSGELKEGLDAHDALLSCFPAGTVSGAPKLRAMEIIAELERESRGVYAGAIGYFGFNGTMDSCITIRTIVFKNGKAYIQAGAGIVADSVPENEYEESRNKAQALIRAIQVACDAMRLEEDDEYAAPVS